MLATTRYPQSSIETYHEQGFVVLRNLLSPETAAALYQETMEVISSKNMPDSFLAQSSAYLKDSALDRLNNGGELRAIVSAFMGGPSSLYLPFTAVKGPYQGAFKFHQDNNYTLHDGPSCNCWIAFGNVTKDNGCLKIVPGSHKLGTVESRAMFVDADGNESHRTVAEEPTEWLDVELNPGDAVLFTRLTIHASGENKTDKLRVAYAVQFHRDDTKWLNKETNEWALLKESERWEIGPVERFEVAAG